MFFARWPFDLWSGHCRWRRNWRDFCHKRGKLPKRDFMGNGLIIKDYCVRITKTIKEKIAMVMYSIRFLWRLRLKISIAGT